MLNYPDTALVNHAIERANLTATEKKVIFMREHENYTIESLAEELECSDSTIKRYYASGMKKLDICWSSLAWLHILAENI